MQPADEHTIDLHGREYTLYPGLLAQAHELGLQSIDETIVQIPTEENGKLAIVRAVVTDKNGRKFVGIGDASPQSVGRNIAPHVLRMASTRAKARAFRDMVGVTAFEEMGGEDVSENKLSAVPDDMDEEEQHLAMQRATPDADQPARKSQIDLLESLAVEWRGEDGVGRLQTTVGKPLNSLTRAEADEWIDRLTPEKTR